MDPTKANLILRKALFRLDQNRLAEGERLLRESLAMSDEQGDIGTAGTVLCCLADLLHQQGRLGEAEAFLERFDVFHSAHRDLDDLFDAEAARVRAIRAAIERAGGRK